METASEGAPKRALDKADDGGGTKKLKTDAEDHQFLPTVEKIRNVEDPIKWSLLPSIVYNLLTLFKKTEKSNSDEDKQVCKTVVFSSCLIFILKNDEIIPYNVIAVHHLLHMSLFLIY